MAAVAVAVASLLAIHHPVLPRREMLARVAAGLSATAVSIPNALASKDCFTDCQSNCVRNAPGSTAYCKQTCDEYCAQPDRRDGLSGSVSSDAGEVGFASAFDYTNRVTRKLNSNVEYGTDRLPAVPGLEGSAAAQKLAEAVGVRKRGRADSAQ